MSPLLLLVALSGIQSIQSSIATPTTSPTTVAFTSASFNPALIAQELANLTLRDWYNYEDKYFTKILSNDIDQNNRYFYMYKVLELLESASALWLMGHMAEYNRVEHWVATQFKPFIFEDDDDGYFTNRLFSCLIALHSLTDASVYLEKIQQMVVIWDPLIFRNVSLWPLQLHDYHYLSEVTGKPEYVQVVRKWGEKVAEKINKEKMTGEYTVDSLLAKAKFAFFSLTADKVNSMKQQIETIFANPKDWDLTTINATNLWFFEHNGILGGHHRVRRTFFDNEARLVVVFALTAEAIMKFSNINSCSSLKTFNKREVAKTVRTLQDSSLMWQRALELLDTYWILTESRIPIKTVPAFIMVDYTSNHGNFFTGKMAEIYFYLWRLTGGEQRYRQMAWWLAQALLKYAWNEETKQIENIDTQGKIVHSSLSKDDLHMTMRYLYLTFLPVEQYPLDRWSFGEQGHLYPICNGKLRRC